MPAMPSVTACAFIGLAFAPCIFASGVTSSYKAAAVEFAPEQAPPNSTDEAISAVKGRNVESLASFAKSAKEQGAQIIVMPEYGITGDGVSNADFNRVTLIPFLEENPSNVTNPCLEADKLPMSPSIVKLSCVARSLEMVVVFNLLTRIPCAGSSGCPSDGQLLHNTAIAVAEDGALLSVYHKRHPFGDESAYLDASTNKTKSRFTTKFGVTFGMFICFDMLWELNDADVDDIIFPTDWVNGVLGVGPSAREAQTAWSALHGKNLIAANYGGFGKDSSGSGIYHKGHALVSFFNPTKDPKSKLLVADVPRQESQLQYV